MALERWSGLATSECPKPHSAIVTSRNDASGESSPNRFIDDLYDIITSIFHYHYQWNKADEKQRNRAAIIERLAYIEALQSRSRRRIEFACRKHLQSARHTLVRSLASMP